VTADVLLDMPTRRRALPQIFNRLVVILTIQAHLFALVIIVQSAHDYQSLPACLALWVVSLAVPIACLVVARRADGALPTGPFLAATGVLVLIDLAVTALVRLPDRGGEAVWTWGVIGVTILGFAVLRPARDVLLVAAGHSLIAVAVTATVLHHPGVGAFALLLVANAAATPALAAAQYLNLYVQAVHLREQAVADRRRIQTRFAAEEAIEEDAAGRLQALRAEVVPLLSSVADGTLSVHDPQVALLAHRLGDGLRRELTAARNGQWLLPLSRAAQRDTKGTSPGPRVDLLDPNRLLCRLQDTDRAALAALLDVLHSFADWQRLSLALAPEDGRPASPGGSPSAAPALTATVVATGSGAAAACRDAAMAAAARQLGANLHLETSDVLVAETSLALSPPVRFLGVTTYGCP
jgi:hypothetical protein